MVSHEGDKCAIFESSKFWEVLFFGYKQWRHVNSARTLFFDRLSLISTNVRINAPLSLAFSKNSLIFNQIGKKSQPSEKTHFFSFLRKIILGLLKKLFYNLLISLDSVSCFTVFILDKNFAKKTRKSLFSSIHIWFGFNKHGKILIRMFVQCVYLIFKYYYYPKKLAHDYYIPYILLKLK